MTNREIALYETDVQYDFCNRNGALFVFGFDRWSNEPYGAEAVLPNVFALHKKAKEQGWRIMGSVDRHFYEDAELKRNKGGVFVDHCMNGTLGQLRLPELEPQRDVYVRRKDGPLMGVRMYTEEEMRRFVEADAQLIFEKQSYEVGTNPNFEHALRIMFDRGVRKIVFDGFATDYCVKAAVLATAKYLGRFGVEAELYVVEDAIKEVGINFQGEVSREFVEQATNRMREVARFVSTKDVLEDRI